MEPEGEMTIKKGDLYFADLSPVVGSEQGGVRPVLVVQNDVGNKYSPTTIVAPFTTKKKTSLPTHVYINGAGLRKPSTVMLEQLRTVDGIRLMWKIGEITNTSDIANIDTGLYISLMMKLQQYQSSKQTNETQKQEHCIVAA